MHQMPLLKPSLGLDLIDSQSSLNFFVGTPPSCFDDVLAEDGELLHVLPLAVHLNFF